MNHKFIITPRAWGKTTEIKSQITSNSCVFDIISYQKPFEMTYRRMEDRGVFYANI